MKEKIERFSEGIFGYELPFICLSEEDIKITVEAGKIYEGHFNISNSEGSEIVGCVYSTSRFMTLQDTSFCNTNNSIIYHFNATTCKAGEEVCGEFHIVSSAGEISLPYTIQIEASYCNSTIGKIKDLFQFANLARMDWSDAKKVFRSEDFERILLANDERLMFVYRNLLKSISTSQALEEFLIVIHKKAAIRLDVDKTQLEYNVKADSIIDKITLIKNHWGYAEIRVSTDAPFIVLEQKFLWADRFIGNNHQVVFAIDPQHLGHGNNYGHIWIKTAQQTLTVNIVCKYKKAEHRGIGDRSNQILEAGLIDTYLRFRLNQIEHSEYLTETQRTLDKLPGPEVSYIKDLMKTHLAIISDKNLLAEELLSDFSKEEVIIRKKSVLEYCAYLYLEALYHKDETIINNATDTIRKFYMNGHFDWRILWFLLYLDNPYTSNKGKKLADIKEQFDAGCRSPILYYETVCIINDEPYLLRDLSDFEIQVLNYGIKNWMLSKETTKQYTYLAGKLKSFNQVVYRGLTRLYDEFDTNEILSAICCMLIKGLKKSQKYFEWYRLGIEAQLRITELYEYYMYSINETLQDQIAQPVLLYFIYNNSLNDSMKAFLYAGVIKNKNTNEPIYRSYYKKMELFAFKMLEGHYINKNLAVLYKEFLNRNTIDTDVLNLLPYVLYRHELICNNLNMVSLIVIHKELGNEVNIPLINGSAQVDIFTSNAEIIFIDSFGNRYVESVEYSLNPFMDILEYEKYCMNYSNNPMLLLHLFDHYQSHRILGENAIQVRKKVLMIEGLSAEHTTYCHQTLIHYYYENYNEELLEYYLNAINLKLLHSDERTKIIELMLIRAEYQKTMDALETFDYEGIPVNRLVKLCSGWIKSPRAENKQDYLVKLCYFVFSHGKYDEEILRYLITYYKGSTRDMFKLWQSAKDFEIESHELEERLLTQMLSAGSYLGDSFLVFSSYYKAVTNHLLVKAFLSYYAYKYLVHDQVINKDLFQIIKRELFYDENDVYLLAWLKYNADKPLEESEIVFAEYNIHKIVKKGIILPFLLQYKNKLVLPDRIEDKLFVSYNADPKRRIFIHYRMTKSKFQEFVTERMPDVFMGIHVKEFTLFHHEELQYYITEETDDDTNITESFNIVHSCEAPECEDSNYNHINLMLMSLEMQDDATLLNMMEDYAKKEYMILACFHQIDLA